MLRPGGERGIIGRRYAEFGFLEETYCLALRKLFFDKHHNRREYKNAIKTTIGSKIRVLVFF